MPHRATQESTSIGQEAEKRGKWVQEPLLWFFIIIEERTDEAG